MALRPSMALLPLPRLTLIQPGIGSHTALSLDDRYLVNYGSGNTAYVWGMEDGSRVGSFAEDNPIRYVSFSPEVDLMQRSVAIDRFACVDFRRSES